MRQTVAAESFKAGGLPGVCVRTGTEATEWLPVKAKSRVGIVWLLLLCGLFPFLLVRLVTVKRVLGYLPVNRAEVAERRRQIRAARPTVDVRRAATRLAIVGLICGVVAGAVLIGVSYQNVRGPFDTEQARFDRLAGEVGRTPKEDTYQASWAPYELSDAGCVTTVSPPSDGKGRIGQLAACPPELAFTFALGNDDWGRTSKNQDTIAALGARYGSAVSTFQYSGQRHSLGLGAGPALAVAVFVGIILVGLVGLLLGSWIRERHRARVRVGGVRRRPRVSLDSTGALVVIHNPHPAFAEACGPSLSGKAPPAPVPATPPAGSQDVRSPSARAPIASHSTSDIARNCTSCGATVAADAMFCARCGANLTVTAPRTRGTMGR